MEALKIECPGCGSTINYTENITECPYCGQVLYVPNSQHADLSVKIKFPINKAQVFGKKCYVYDVATGNLLGECEQGETIKLNIIKPIKIKVVMKGFFGKRIREINPGEKYMVCANKWGQIYLKLVDHVSDIEYDFTASFLSRLLSIFYFFK